MLKRTRFSVITLAVAVVCSVGLHAQTLQTGTWTGTAVGPDGSSNDVTFEVEKNPVWTPDGTRVVFRGGLSITYNSTQGRIPLRNVKLEDDTLTYEFTVGGGLDVACALKRQEDGSYTGPCDFGGGQMGRHTMKPPEV